MQTISTAPGAMKPKFPFPEASTSAILWAGQRNLFNSSPLAIPEKSIGKPIVLLCFFFFFFFTINNLHVLNGVPLQRSASSVTNCFLMQLSYFFSLFLSKELLVLSNSFLSWGKNWKTPNVVLLSHLHFLSAFSSGVPMGTMPSKHLSLFCSPYVIIITKNDF